MDQTRSQSMRAVGAARYLGISRSTLAKWRMRGDGPPWHYLGPRLVIYYRHEIEAWLEDCDRQRPRGGRRLPAVSERAP